MKKCVTNKPGNKPFLDIHRRLCGGRWSAWEVWADFVDMAACEISMAIDVEARDRRAAHVERTRRKYTEQELKMFSQLFGEVVLALEAEPQQDYLGQMFMELELGSHWHGQFFTPYNVCSMMARIDAGQIKERIEEKGWISVNDCACGAGALLIAMADECLRQGINYQKHMFFVAQDIDHIAAMMCYIQLSLRGCAGYVAVGDSLLHPVNVGHSVMFPTHDENLQLWYTPMYFEETWTFRRMLEVMKVGQH